jgi:hypothetical protein
MNDDIDLEEVISLRREYASRSLRTAPLAETQALIHGLFADNPTDPWFEACSGFLNSHSSDVILRGELPDHFAFLYFPKVNKGLWYSVQAGLKAMGPIGPKGLAALAEIAAEKNLVV